MSFGSDFQLRSRKDKVHSIFLDFGLSTSAWFDAFSCFILYHIIVFSSFHLGMEKKDVGMFLLWLIKDTDGLSTSYFRLLFAILLSG